MTILPKNSDSVGKIILGTAVLLGLGFASVSYAQKTSAVKAVDQVELDRYLGVWYEVARKPLYFQNKCDRDVSATYTLNENGHVDVDNKCYSKNGELNQSVGEAFVQNSPYNSKLKVSFLPNAVRWLPLWRGDYWVLKIDPDYQTVLVGEPNRKYMWVLSRTPHPNQTVVNEYLDYAKSMGYDLHDLIRTKQSAK